MDHSVIINNQIYEFFPSNIVEIKPGISMYWHLIAIMLFTFIVIVLPFTILFFSALLNAYSIKHMSFLRLFSILFFFIQFISLVVIIFFIVKLDICIAYHSCFFYFEYLGIRFSYSYVLDSISSFFALLVPFILMLCSIFFKVGISNRSKLFFQLLIIMDFILLAIFLSYDFFQFVIFSELSIIPMWFMISIWGSRTRRSISSYIYFFFSMIASIFMLISVLFIFKYFSSTSLINIYSIGGLNEEISYVYQFIIQISLIIAFAIKLPAFPFHIWLPEVHGEASTPGSVILASLYLKVSALGFIRYVFPFIFPSFVYALRPIIISLTLIGVFYCSIIIFRQVDLKKFIAYTSVVHMNMFLLGLFICNPFSIIGACFSMFVHSVVSALLFFAAGSAYDRHGTRISLYMPRLVVSFPQLSAIFFFGLLANIGFPLTPNFFAELTLISGVYTYSAFLALLLVMGIALLGLAHYFFLLNLTKGGLLSLSTQNFFYLTEDGHVDGPVGGRLIYAYPFSERLFLYNLSTKNSKDFISFCKFFDSIKKRYTAPLARRVVVDKQLDFEELVVCASLIILLIHMWLIPTFYISTFLRNILFNF